MKRILIPTMALVTAGCLPEGEQDPNDTGNNSETGETTHYVCGGDGDNAEPRVGIDQSLDFTVVDSLYDAMEDIDLETIPEADETKAAFATGIMAGVGLAEAFTLLTHLYDCSEAIYDLNQCNWSIESGDPDDADVEISTSFSGQSYITTVSAQETGQAAEDIFVFEGVLGDVGNGVLTIYEEDDDGNDIVGSRSYSRDANGTESVVFDSGDGTEWILQETADCNGYLEHTSPTSDGLNTITLDVEWTRDGDAYTGLLEYTDSDTFVGTYTLNF